ncbi:MAG: S8 family serine peptidase [Bdellovibrionales bacterium]
MDFVSESNNVEDNHGHGTHISGIVAGLGKIEGVARSADVGSIKIMVLKYYDPKSINRDAATLTARAIDYAINNGAQIINYSSGGSAPSDLERSAIVRALKKNILVITAAGNDGRDLSREKFYPASYNLPNIISVASADPLNKVVSSSNYGASQVDLAALGFRVNSIIPNNKRGYMTGTSQATAVVSWLAGQLMSQYEFKGNIHWVKNVLVNSGTKSNFWKNKTASERVAIPEGIKQHLNRSYKRSQFNGSLYLIFIKELTILSQPILFPGQQRE